MKRLFMAATMLSISSCVYADIVNSICVTVDDTDKPLFFLIDEDTKITVDENAVSIVTKSITLQFFMEYNPVVKFADVDESVIYGYIGIDYISIDNKNVQVYNIDGTMSDGIQISRGTYILRSNKKDYKFLVK